MRTLQRVRRLACAAAVALLSACGGSGPAESPDTAPGSGAEQRVVEGGHIVVSSGTRIGLGEAGAGARAWRQQRGPQTPLAGDILIAPEVSVATEFRYRADGDQTGILVQPRSDPGCAEGARCAAASKRRITPTASHVEGVREERLLIAPKTQRFNLGGFGIDPTQNFPAPLDQLGDLLTIPAEQRFHRNRVGDDEYTWLRSFLLSEAGETVVFLSIDAVGAGNIITAEMRRRIARATGLPEANLLIGSTHSHAGADLQGLWGGVPQDWLESVLYPEAVAVVEDALAAQREVVLTVRQGDAAAFNSYRRPRVDPSDTADPLMTLLEARDRASGRPVGRLLQFNAHPTSINEDPRTPHPDYILGAVDRLEADGGVAAFYNGPIADASARGGDAPDDATPYERVRARGHAMAEHALRFGGGQPLAEGLQVRHVQATLPVTNPLFITAAAAGAFNRYYNFTGLPLDQIPFVSTLFDALPQLAPVAQTAVSRIRLGSGEAALDIVTIPGEATNTYGQSIRALGDGSPMMLLGLTHNSFGYIIPADEFNYVDTGGGTGLALPFTNYEEFVSLGPLTAPLLRLQAYAPLFDVAAGDPNALPPSLTACFDDPAGADCIVNGLAMQLDFLQQGLADQCRAAGGPESFCALLDPVTPLGDLCRTLPLPPAVCDLLGEAGSAQ
ncbi:hypothetical protein KHP57_03515 [Algiphilus sp. NNCM1]|uniref:hypothetical protein n=1 Tax=Algiphilus sp. TaxID=1872431 RepID=UPI001CA7A21B|nr:hypothetical protein [Algiphilus sp.]MBY8964760.1 hypothetical protein [Algiphilus acroporae]MCI5061570.1 hypothetical protein [Algiphilus sp.]MCI5103671.1 hypothetical protein [Algiphilus sp.]